MMPCHVVEIFTPKKVRLNGLLFGPLRPRRAILWVHGLGSSTFSKLDIVEKLVDHDTAVLTFNNRGHDRVAGLTTTKGKMIQAGSAHEKFRDCIDDIQGAVNFLLQCGIKNIFLAGHSTGCQKSMYWASKRGKRVKGIILLAPVSDYAGAVANHGKKKIERVTRYARSLVRRGKPHEFIPLSRWSEELNDAQRFLSLYTLESVEEIFTYAQPKKNPRTLQSVKIPILILWAEKDEFADRSAKKIEGWFAEHLKLDDQIVIVPGVPHSFKGGEKVIAREVRKFIAAR